jgi:RNA polymerase sigma-70 factor (ECF subfamily)
MDAVSSVIFQSFREALESGRLPQWEEFVRLTHGLVASTIYYSLSRWRTPQRELVEDLVQETFLKLCADNFNLLRRFRSQSSEAFAAYLRTVAASVAADGRRRDRAQKRGSGGTALELDEARDVPASADSTGAVERTILLEHIENCLSGQKDRDQHVFWLYYRHGFTAEAISEFRSLDLSSSGVESLLRRLVTAVRKCLEKRGQQIPSPGKGDSA